MALGRGGGGGGKKRDGNGVGGKGRREVDSSEGGGSAVRLPSLHRPFGVLGGEGHHFLLPRGRR